MRLTEAEVLALAVLIETPFERMAETCKSQEVADVVRRVLSHAEDIIHESRATRR